MPHAAVDQRGTIHLMYFRGAMTGGDLRYVSLEPGGTDWSAPVSVNSAPHSAIGMGPMDGGDMALSEHDGVRIHAVWYLTDPLRVLYTRSEPGRASFEPHRVLWDLDGEVFEARPSVAVNEQGRVFIAWHGATVHGTDDAHRGVFLMTSGDGGDTFDSPASHQPRVWGGLRLLQPGHAQCRPSGVGVVSKRREQRAPRPASAQVDGRRQQLRRRDHSAVVDRGVPRHDDEFRSGPRIRSGRVGNERAGLLRGRR